ncbi:peptidase G2 autoproteolytic cleavage domain-containing protein [Bacillus sp. FSL R12-0069]|uniref:peptidase G2 autoproteolytic cleavage domain-containing protein n=1 Tax=Bacillus sp. FSL R12-0069 TaxID=2975342 RepID=UPI0030FB9C6E
MGLYTRLLCGENWKYYVQEDNHSVDKEMKVSSEAIYTHIEGANTKAEGIASHAEGSSTIAKGIASHAEGANTVAHADYTHVEGANTIAKGIASHAEGNSNVACGDASHVEGSHTTTGSSEDILQGNSAHAEGYYTHAHGNASHAEGDSTNAYGDASHAEGSYTIAGDSQEKLQGTSAHAEGYFTIAYGDASHAEGHFTFAKADFSHAEGFYTATRGNASHAEGAHTIAEGDFSHAEGINTIAIGKCSHTEGIGTYSAWEGAHIMGKYGDAEEPYSWFIGNGMSANNKEIGAKWLASTRNMYIDGTTYITGGTNYAEMFEVKDETIDIGFFVTLNGEYVQKVTNPNDYIVGITTATPSVLGNSAEMRWKDKYIVDEWGIMQQEIEVSSESIKTRAKINPIWDKSKIYKSRISRKEWVSVGLIGQIRVRDDGTCVVGLNCSSNHDGIATKSQEGYRVLKRINSHQILILLK